MARPDFSEITSAKEFNQWYWLKQELVDICKRSGIPSTGRKFELRDRIAFALENPGKPLEVVQKRKTVSKFNWSKAELGLKTIITDNVSFGPNFRNFMKSRIGTKFSCHGDFMHWVRKNEGKTLEDAIAIWHELEDRKKSPDFKRTIAKNNMLAQYVRDFLADNPNETLKNALHFWNLKKKLPTPTGFITYQRTDLELS
ncbi:DUF6434 domain-containing protein [Costertonia aggregata]|uniref:DUF6434 domain-containing protein n=1 Tax=Costertonia aggregata TaxID=343403 RepID=A0A7H9AN08_9FLAO|nr:DUF6434 domain-containing protein [Costertonia aggregata]QLG44842.1 hypothetical protein HYG79_05575 [Costertonia aggregata]